MMLLRFTANISGYFPGLLSACLNTNRITFFAAKQQKWIIKNGGCLRCLVMPFLPITRLSSIALWLALSLAACGTGGETPTGPVHEVNIIVASSQIQPLQRERVGRLSPFATTEVRAPGSGVLLKRLYEENSIVREKQALFQIDPTLLRSALEEAEAALEKTQAQYETALVNMARYDRALALEHYVRRTDLEAARAAKQQAEQAVQQAEAAIQQARFNLEHARITATVSGLARPARIEEGTALTPETVLTELAHIDRLYINFSISVEELKELQATLPAITKGVAEIQVSLPNGSAYPHTGTLDISKLEAGDTDSHSAVGTDEDGATDSVALRAYLPNPDYTFLPDSFVHFHIDLGRQYNAFAIPQQAVLHDAEGSYVLVVESQKNDVGKVARRSVTIEGHQEGQWLVSTGITSGERVVLPGGKVLSEGDWVKPIGVADTADNLSDLID